MARTFTQTHTRTYTRARIYLIQHQFQSFARRFGFSDKCYQALVEAVDKQIVHHLIVIAMDGNSAMGSVSLTIDWETHDRVKEIAEVTVDERWQSDVAPELDQAMDTFERFVDDCRLKTQRRVGLSDECKAGTPARAYAMELLGLTEGSPIKWGGEVLGAKKSLGALSEMSTALSFVDDGL